MSRRTDHHRAVAPATRSLIPALVLAFLVSLLVVGPAQANDPVELKGRVVERHGDDFRHGREVDLGVFLESKGKLYRLPDQAEKYVGQLGTARGEMRDGQPALTQFAASGASASSSGSSATTDGVSGAKRVAVILFNFSNDTSQPFTPASVATNYFASGAADRSVANYYKEVSWGQLQLTGQAYGWYTIAATNQTCDPGTWATQADAAAKAAGVDLSTFDYKTYVYPGASSCGWGGMGQMPGNQNWINGSPTVGIMTHELGHNLGLNHAVSTSCTLANGDKVAFGPNCTTSEYGDQYDVMGANGPAYHVNEWHRAMLGFTGDIQTVSTDGTYTLSPVESSLGSPHALRIPRGDGTYFDLEYRQPYGIFDAFAATSPAVTGVMVRWVSSYTTANKPMLIDTTPQTPSFSDAPLAAGQSFADPITGIKVTTVSVSPSGAQVQIQTRAGDYTPPNVSITSPNDGGAVTLPTTVTVSATDNVGVAKVELYRQRVGADLAPGTLVGTDTSAPYTFSWVEGQSGKYTFTAVAYDTSGISSVSPTATVEATQSDTTPPADPTGFRSIANAQTSVATTWAPSTDNVGVAYYQLSLDGVKVATTTGTSYTFTGLTCATGYRLGVVAVDSAGNASPGVGITAWTTACSGDTQPPTMPTGVQASATGPTSVQLTWKASTDNVGVSFYRVDRDGVTVTQTTSTSFSDGGLVAGKTYAYTVTAYDAAMNASGTSAPVSVTTPTSTSDTQPPSAPTNIQVNATSSSSITLVWQASTDNVGVAGYRVYRGGTLVGQTSSTSYTDSGLQAGTTYTYTVTAYDAAGNTSAASSPLSVATQPATDTQAPTAPGNVQGSALKGRKVGLTWSAATDNVGVTSYRIFRDGVAIATVAGGSLTYSDSASRGTHVYYVVALDGAGNQSSSSNTVTVTI